MGIGGRVASSSGVQSYSTVSTQPSATSTSDSDDSISQSNTTPSPVDCVWSTTWANVGNCTALLGVQCGLGVQQQKSSGKLVVESNGGTCSAIPTRFTECDTGPCTNVTLPPVLNVSIGCSSTGETNTVDSTDQCTSTRSQSQTIPTMNSTISNVMSLSRTLSNYVIILYDMATYLTPSNYTQYLEISSDMNATLV
jgi:hypothetical protein